MSELTPSQRQELTLLTSTADRLEDALRGVSEKQLDYSAGAGEWSIRQIVHHLVDGSIIWTMVFNRVLAMPEAVFQGLGSFPGNEAWADALEFHKRPIGGALALVRSHHQFLAEAAAHFPDRWERYVTIPDPGGKEVKITAEQIIRMLGEHLAEHVATIEEIKRRHGI